MRFDCLNFKFPRRKLKGKDHELPARKTQPEAVAPSYQAHHLPIASHTFSARDQGSRATNHGPRITFRGEEKAPGSSGGCKPGAGGLRQKRGRSKFNLGSSLVQLRSISIQTRFKLCCRAAMRRELRRRACNQSAQRVHILMRKNQSYGCCFFFQMSQSRKFTNLA